MDQKYVFSAVVHLDRGDVIDAYLRIGWITYETSYIIDEEGKRVSHYLGWPDLDREPEYPGVPSRNYPAFAPD